MVRKHCRRENTSLWLHFESIALWKPIDQLKVFFNLMCMGSHDISMFIFSFHSSINSQWNYSHMDGGLSLNMCLELWWQAGRDYNASNIEFCFRSFVAVGVTSVQLKHGGAQQQVCCQNHPMNTGAEGEHGKKNILRWFIFTETFRWESYKCPCGVFVLWGGRDERSYYKHLVQKPCFKASNLGFWQQPCWFFCGRQWQKMHECMDGWNLTLQKWSADLYKLFPQIISLKAQTRLRNLVQWLISANWEKQQPVSASICQLKQTCS